MRALFRVEIVANVLRQPNVRLAAGHYDLGVFNSPRPKPVGQPKINDRRNEGQITHLVPADKDHRHRGARGNVEALGRVGNSVDFNLPG
jgi:hypothetical protein